MTQNKVTSKDIFHCEQCGDCCTGYGGTYITPKDITAIADYINADAEKFIEASDIDTKTYPYSTQDVSWKTAKVMNSQTKLSAILV